MPFWPVVLGALIGVPFVLMFTGMGMIFAAAGLAGGPQESRAQRIVYGWLAFAWLLVGVFGAFGLAPAWRAWHGGAEDFAGGLQVFVDWLLGVGAAGVLVAAAVRALAAIRRDGATRSPLLDALRWLLLGLGFVPWAAIIAWIAWPLVLWAVRGSYEWPVAATGWRHTGAIALVLFAVMLVEEAVRKRSRR
jgi:hypothetical protein